MFDRIGRAVRLFQKDGITIIFTEFSIILLPRVERYFSIILRKDKKRIVVGTVFLFGLSTVGWKMVFGNIFLPVILLSVFFFVLAIDLMNKFDYARKIFSKTSKLQGIFLTVNDIKLSETDSIHVKQLVATSPENSEVLIGEIDNDGRMLSQFKSFPNVVHIDQSNFIPRYRFPITVVAYRGKIIIKKVFRRDILGFFRELIVLGSMDEKANAPKIFGYNIFKLTIYKQYINGRTLRDILVENGANILTVDTETDKELQVLTTKERNQAIWRRGSALVTSLYGDSFASNLIEQINFLHRMRISNLSLTFGNVMVDVNDQVWLIDFDKSFCFTGLFSLLFSANREQDLKNYNEIYQGNVLTNDKVELEVIDLEKSGAGEYSPILIGNGYKVGPVRIISSGSGRWNYINKAIMKPLICGKSILDLGSHNGVMPLMMLKDGAKKVVGLELDSLRVSQAKRFRSIVEWADSANYDFQIHEATMSDIIDHNYGEFDVVTAFCSLYYLSEQLMAQVVRRSSEIAPVIVLQLKIDTRSEAEDNKAVKSSREFSEKLLLENGYSRISYHTIDDFSRPILIGYI